MYALPRPPVNGRVQETRVPSALDRPASLPPLIRLFPRDASPTGPATPPLPRSGEPAPEGAGAEVWYAVFLSAFLVGLLVLGGFWIWLNVRFV